MSDGTVSEMGAFTLEQDGHTYVIFYRHISRIIYRPDRMVIISDDGGTMNIDGRDTVKTLLEIMRQAIPATVAILLKGATS